MARRPWLLCGMFLSALPAAPADSSACAACHPGIARSYARTGMARSFYRPAPGNTVEDYRTRNIYYHAPSDTYYVMIQRDGQYFQRQYQLGFDGKQTSVRETAIDYVLGSGNHARTYLHRTARNTLVQLPLGWYAEKGGTWAMNPGYDRPDHQGLGRTISYDCMFCHNAYPAIPGASNDPRMPPVFTSVPEGIDCRRCHGPGDRHVAAAGRPGAGTDEIRSAIVNPARLSAERQVEVCLQCHLESTSSPLPASMVRYERRPFSYQPGEPLGDFMLHFDRASGPANEERFEITGSAYRLRQSQCFRKSGTLKCTTCHDPHAPSQGEAAAKHYTQVCRQCHSAPFEQLVAAGKHVRSDDCIACHMPKRRTDDVVHAVMTDHRIPRTPPARDLLAAKTEVRQSSDSAYQGEVVLYYPPSLPKPEDELYLAIAQVTQNANLKAGIPRLAAAIGKFHPERAEYYLQLGDALVNAGRSAEAVPVYEEARRREPQSAAAAERLALCLRNLRQPARAEAIFREAWSRAPGAALSFHLGMTYLDRGRVSDAIAAFEKARELDPELVEADNSAGALWFESGDAARAETALRNAIRMQPNYAQAHNNLGNLLSASGRFEEARYHFEAALRYRDDYNGARYNYALALVRARRSEDAQRQVEAILQSDPRSAAAHEFLGNLLAAKGRFAPAIQHYREAIRIEPQFTRAVLDLGAALLNSGDRAAARPHLENAARSSDPAIRAEAQKLLEKAR